MKIYHDQGYNDDIGVVTCHSNDMTSLPILLVAAFPNNGNCSSAIAAPIFVKFKRTL